MAESLGNRGSDYWRVKLVYTTSETDTTFTINTSTYLRYSKECRMSVGLMTKYVSIGGTQYTITKSGDIRHDAGYDLFLYSKSVTYNKGTVAQSKVVKAYLRRSGSDVTALNGTSETSVTITIPKIRLTLTYNANGGSGAPSSQKALYGNSVTIPSTKPTRSRYDFLGWNTNSAGTGTSYAAGNTKTLTANTTLYAKWKAHKSIAYSGGAGATCNIATAYYSEGTTITLPAAKPTKPGHDFLGWSLNNDGSGNLLNPSSSFTLANDTILYAVWHESYVPPVISNLRAYRTIDNATVNNYGSCPPVKDDGTNVYFDCEVVSPKNTLGTTDDIVINIIFGDESYWMPGAIELIDAETDLHRVYGYSPQDYNLQTTESVTVTIEITVVSYNGDEFVYNSSTFVSSENYLWDAFKGKNNNEVYQSFAIGCAARDFNSTEIAPNGNFDIAMDVKIGSVDFTISDEEYDELMSYL